MYRPLTDGWLESHLSGRAIAMLSRERLQGDRMSGVAIRPLLAIVFFFARGLLAFGQAGSIGGTIGKSEKSVSGGTDTEQPSVKQSRSGPVSGRHSVAAQSPNDCRKVVGIWTFTFEKSFETAINSNGTGSFGPGLDFTWTCSGNQFAYTALGITERLTLSPGGMAMSGIDVMNGDRMTAVRKSR